jgi:hypothetical protein
VRKPEAKLEAVRFLDAYRLLGGRVMRVRREVALPKRRLLLVGSVGLIPHKQEGSALKMEFTSFELFLIIVVEIVLLQSISPSASLNLSSLQTPSPLLFSEAKASVVTELLVAGGSTCTANTSFD